MTIYPQSLRFAIWCFASGAGAEPDIAVGGLVVGGLGFLATIFNSVSDACLLSPDRRMRCSRAPLSRKLENEVMRQNQR